MNDKKTLMLNAAKEGDCDTVNSLLVESCALANVKDDDDMTPRGYLLDSSAYKR